MNAKGTEVSIYLENLAPLFLIDQNEGWVDLQSLQVFRYTQREITQAAFEYLIGADLALSNRLDAQRVQSREMQLKEAAESLSLRIISGHNTRGRPVQRSARGSISDIAKRWAKETILQSAKRQCGIDLKTERKSLLRRAETLREKLVGAEPDPADVSAASRASQQVIDLKTRQHSARSELRKARTQLSEQRRVLKGIEHRIGSSKDVLRLKESGIGRLKDVECPTCHRNISPRDFHLTEQSSESVSAHIVLLENDRLLMRSNIAELEIELERIVALISRLDGELRDAQRSLRIVNAAVGTVREQIGKVASDLASTERKIDQQYDFSAEAQSLQSDLDRWLERAVPVMEPRSAISDLDSRLREFLKFFRINLLSLGHSEVSLANQDQIRLDENYIPYLGPRRLRSMGSASDYSRLVAGYVLALAEASVELGGPHPGFVVLDEPLQQNPDPEHREKFVTFLKGLGSIKDLPIQVVVLTNLRAQEVESLRRADVVVRELASEHLISLSVGKEDGE